MVKKWLVVRRHEGHGDNLNCVASASVIARETGRNLFINWCFSGYLRGMKQRTNLFPLIFKMPMIPGINKIIAGDGMDLEGVRWRLSHDLEANIFNREEDVLILDNYHWKYFGFEPTDEDYTLFYDSLVFLDPIQNEIDKFVETNFKGRVLGVHVRQGNGEFEHRFYGNGSAPAWIDKRRIRDEGWFLGELKQAIAKCKYDTLYLSCDCRHMIDLIKIMYPDLVVMKKWIPPYGTGPVHKTGIQHIDQVQVAIWDMMEMYYLSKCDHLVKTARGEYHVFYKGEDITNVPPSVQNVEQWNAGGPTEGQTPTRPRGF